MEDEARSFSQRQGVKPIRSFTQLESMDEALRNRLWNAVTLHYWDKISETHLPAMPPVRVWIQQMWHDLFKEPVDTINEYWPNVLKQLRQKFFAAPWNEVYDFVEFVAGTFPVGQMKHKFIEGCNGVLEQENSAYRFVGGKIVSITTPEEIGEVEDARKHTGPLAPVAKHIQAALDLLADRKKPSYRNVIKESISAVESACKIATGNSKATLDKALKEMETKTKIHPALREAFAKLYGWTSDAEGIRHALMDQSTLGFAEAKFMLVACSAFINLLVAKLSSAATPPHTDADA